MQLFFPSALRYQNGKHFTLKRLFREFIILINMDEQYEFNVSDVRLGLFPNIQTDKAIMAFQGVHFFFAKF